MTCFSSLTSSNDARSKTVRVTVLVAIVVGDIVFPSFELDRRAFRVAGVITKCSVVIGMCLKYNLRVAYLAKHVKSFFIESENKFAGPSGGGPKIEPRFMCHYAMGTGRLEDAGVDKTRSKALIAQDLALNPSPISGGRGYPMGKIGRVFLMYIYDNNIFNKRKKITRTRPQPKEPIR